MNRPYDQHRHIPDRRGCRLVAIAGGDDDVMIPGLTDRGIVERLRCPVCAQPLTPQPGALRCPSGHGFDLARQGYADLTGRPVTHPGDTPDMVAAREALLHAGHLDVVSDAVVDAIPPGTPGLAIDVGAGTGHHLARVLDARPDLRGLAVDVSKPALRRAARAHPRIAAVRADVWRGLPVLDAAATVVIDVFAPRSPAEFHRVLAADGVLVVVTPAPDHLAELVGQLGLITVDPRKQERLATGLAPWFEPAGQAERAAELRLSRSDARALVGMGPSAWHLDPRRLTESLDAIAEPIVVTASIRLSRWRPRPAPAEKA